MDTNKIEPQEIITVLNMLLEESLITQEEHRKAKSIAYSE